MSGGFDNTASGYRSAIGGGWGNVASGAYTNVCGGGFNTASDGSATVGGGYANYATGIYSTAAGGLGNTASGAYSFAAGGNSNAAGGAYSFAAGRRARVNHNGTFAWADSSVDADFNSSAANQFLIRAAGGVGIGTNSPAEQLHVVGNIFATGCVIGSNIACPSDARFKKNIQTMDHALDALGHLRGVRYEWRHDEFPDREFTEGQQIGLIAQEVQNVIPQAVVKQSDGYLAVDYARLVPLLIEAVKEQQKRIEALEKKLERQTP